MWDHVCYYLSRVLAVVWFAGATLLLITIPACMYKIFSALWQADDSADEQPVQESGGIHGGTGSLLDENSETDPRCLFLRENAPSS